MMMKYNLVDTPEKLKELDSILMNGDHPVNPMLAFDTETNGLELYKTTVVGFSISFNDKTGYYIPLLKWVKDPKSFKTRSFKKVKYDAYMDGHLQCVWTGQDFPEFVTPKEYDLPKRMPLIPALVNRWLSKCKLIMHNAPFDTNMTYISMGIDLKDAVFVDTALLLHILDENNPAALKKAAERYRHQLGINPHAMAAQEKKELDVSIIQNGGKPGQVWRADLDVQMKYACADTFLTFGIFQVAIKEFAEKFGERGLDWFFNKEVMPVCKEVVIDMKRKGVYIDVPYFEKIHAETQTKMMALEDEIIKVLRDQKLLKDFTLGKSVDEEVSHQALVKKMIELEGRSIPTKLNKKTGEVKETLAKGEVKKVYQKDPHWIWGYIIGEDEIKYSEDKIEDIKKELYTEKMNKGREAERKPLKRYRFNIGSDAHLRWLFCDKLGLDARKLPQTDSATKENPIPSVSAEVLQEHMLPRWPWVSKLLSYKRLLKLESTYIRPALLLNIDGWMYMDMKQNGTTSGRFSCSGGYNLQTLPRVDDEMEILESCESCFSSNVEILQDIECMADMKCKDCGHEKKDIPRPSAIKQGFIAPPGYKIINADYSSLEPRCFAFMSGEQALKDVYLKGLDLYSQVYCEIFDHEKQYSADPKAPNFLKKVAKAKRTFIKPIVLGIPYGAEDAQVANLIGAYKEGIDKKTGEVKKYLDIDEGKRVRDAYLGKLKDLKQYMDDMDLSAVTKGYVETLVGRRRHLPYAKTIKDVLDRHGVDYTSLKDAMKFHLKEPAVNFVDKNTGIQVSLTQEALNDIAQALDITQEKLKEKDNWVYIRALLKGDLNNSKNNPIQGLAGHITNKGMLDTNRYLRQQNLEAWVCLQVHDEITGYAKIEHAEAAAACLKTGMEDNEFAKLVDIPMIAEPEICDNLKDSK